MVAPQAEEAPRGKRLTGAALVALIATSVAAASVNLTIPNEGEVHRVYPDPAGIPTFCIGETKNPDPAHIYAHTECMALLRVRMRRDFAAAIVKCVPDFADPANHWAFEATIDAAYNAGPAAVCRSAMARAFNAGDWPTGCRSFPGWYETARGRRYPGLVRRRREEAEYCLTGRVTHG